MNQKTDNQKPAAETEQIAENDSGVDNTAGIGNELNRETGVLAWQELVRFFARGIVIKVDQKLDLVEVGKRVSADDTAAMQAWLDASLVSRASDDDARDWNARQPDFWCLVTAPWVLVQECVLIDESDTASVTIH